VASLRGVLVVSTVNVNGVRAAARKGLLEWLAATAAGVVVERAATWDARWSDHAAVTVIYKP